jgi:hypothetical protein
VIPALPKKGDIIPKPDNLVYKEKEKKNSLRIETLINKKVRLLRFRKTSGPKSSSSVARLKVKATLSFPLSVHKLARFSNSAIS